MATTVKITPASGLLEFYDTAQTSAATLLSTDGSTIQLYATGSTSALTGPSFSSGFTGSGWRVDTGISTTSKSSFEADNLTIRGTMRVYELLINQIRASNGSLVISSTGKAATVSGGPTYTINTDANTNHGFATGDIVRAKRFTGSGTYDSWLSVASTPSTTQFTATVLGGSSVPVAGYEYVRLGSSTDTNRQGVIYMTADDSNAPFISILDGVSAYTAFNTFSTTKVLLGKLSGITSPTFGTLSGYGLYSQNMYLEGNANIAGTLTAGDANGVGSTFYAGNVLTNLIPNSEVASLYFTSLSNITSITDNYSYAPNQTKTASRVIVSNVASFYIEKNMAAPVYIQAGQAYTVSVWLMTSYTEIGKSIVLNFATRTGADYYGQSSKIVVLTNTWQRVSLTITATAACSNFDVWIANSGSGPAWFDVWGTMINKGSYAAVYQKTDSILPAILGTNRVSNSTLDTTAGYTNWYGDASISIVNAGKGQLTGSNGGISTTITGSSLSLNRNYLVKVKLKWIAGSTTVNLSNGSGVCPASWTIDGTERQYSAIFKANYGGAIYWYTQPSQTYEIDDVELYEIYDAYGMWSIAGGFGGTIQNPVVSASSAGLRVLDNSQTATAVTAAGTYIGKYSVSGYQSVLINSAGITGYTGSTTATNFSLPTSGTASIAGWSFDANSLTSTNIGLHSVGYSEGAEILLGHATAYASAKVGLKADGSGKLASGYLTWDTTGNLTIGSTATGDNNVYIAALGSLQFRNATTVLGQLDGATWTLGQDTESRIVITNTDLSLYDGAATPIRRIYLDTTGLTIGKSDDNRITITDSAFSLYEGSAEKINIASTGVTVYGATAWDKAMLIAGGMEIYRNESSATIKTAIFGATTVLGSDTAVTATSTDGCIRIDSTGIKLFENANDRVELLSTGMHIYESNVEVASFGATSTIGIVSGGEYVSIASTGIAMYGNAAQKINIASDGTGWLGTSGSTGITWDASGNMTFGGSITNQGEPVSLTYSGSASYTNIADNDNLDFGTGDFSLELYLRPNSTSVGWIITKGSPENASACGWSLYLNSGSLAVEFNDGATCTSQSLMTGLVVGTWYHVVAVFTRTGSITGYANAVVKSSLNISTRTNSVNNALPVYLGAYSGGSCWSGSIAYARLYNCAISAAEIATLYNNGRPDLAEIPVKYKWGSQTAFYTSDFSAGVNGWGGTRCTVAGNIDAIGGQDNNLRSYASADNANHNFYTANLALTKGKAYKVSVDYYIPSANTNTNGVKFKLGSAGTLTSTQTVLNTWTTYSWTVSDYNDDGYTYAFHVKAGSDTFVGANSVTDDLIYVRNVVITEVGCVAEYKAANSSLVTAYDSSSNTLNGTNTAVTLSNNSKIWSDGFYLSAVGTTPSRIAAASFTSTDIWAGATTLASADTKFVLGDLGTATPKLALGATADSINGTSVSGIYLAGDGTFNFATDANNYIRKTSTNVEVASQDFELKSGNLYLSGNTTSSYLRLGSVTDATTTATTNSGLYVDNSGNFLVKGNTSGTNYIKVTAAGVIDINSSSFLLSTTTLKISSTPYITMGATTPTSATVGTGIWIDATGLYGLNANTQKFKISATDGSITAIAGSIAGFTFASSYLTTGTKVAINTVSGTGVYVGTDGISLGTANGSGVSPFQVTSAGALTATSATITGTVNASGGYIGNATTGWNITSTGIYNGRTSFTDDANAGIWIGSDGIAIGNTGAAKFTVSAAGLLTVLNGKFGTSVNYWEVGSTGLTAVSASTDVVIKYGKTDFAQDTTAGFILGYDYSATKAKFEIGTTATGLLKYDGSLVVTGGTITGGTIQTNTGANKKIILSSDGTLSFHDAAGGLVCTMSGVSSYMVLDGIITIGSSYVHTHGIEGSLNMNTYASAGSGGIHWGSVSLGAGSSGILTTNSAFVASTFNELTLTKQATGFTVAGGTTSKTLTVDATVSTSALAPLASPTFTGTATIPDIITTPLTSAANGNYLVMWHGSTAQGNSGHLYATTGFSFNPSTGTLSTSRLTSTIATGTSPLVVTSTTVVSNLNADTVDAMHFSGTAGSTLNIGTGGTLGTAAYLASTAVARSYDIYNSSVEAGGSSTNTVAAKIWTEDTYGEQIKIRTFYKHRAGNASMVLKCSVQGIGDVDFAVTGIISDTGSFSAGTYAACSVPLDITTGLTVGDIYEVTVLLRETDSNTVYMKNVVISVENY